MPRDRHAAACPAPARARYKARAPPRPLRASERRGLTEEQRIDGHQAAMAPDRRHGPSSRRRHAADARAPASMLPTPPLSTIGKPRMRRLEPIDALVIERRDFAVLLRRQAFEPGLARMHDQRIGAARARPLAANASSASSGSCSSMPMRHLTVTGIVTAAFMAATQSPTSAGSAIRQAPKRPSCTRSDGQPALRLISSKPRSAPIARARGQRARVGAAELQRHRMLGRIETQQPCPIAVQHRAGRQHFGVKQRPARQQPMEKPAVPVGPLHHRGDAKAPCVDHLRIYRLNCCRWPRLIRFNPAGVPRFVCSP